MHLINLMETVKKYYELCGFSHPSDATNRLQCIQWIDIKFDIHVTVSATLYLKLAAATETCQGNVQIHGFTEYFTCRYLIKDKTKLQIIFEVRYLQQIIFSCYMKVRSAVVCGTRYRNWFRPQDLTLSTSSVGNVSNRGNVILTTRRG